MVTATPELSQIKPSALPPPPSDPKVLRCKQVHLEGRSAFVCIEKPKAYEPYLIGAPGVFVALAGFVVVHGLSVRRQRRDEQFKMVQTTRELIASVSKEAEDAWLSRQNRATKGPILIQRVARVGRAIQQLKVRHKSLDVGSLMTGLRQAITLDFEDGSASVERSAEIAIAASDLDEQIILQFLKKYG